MWNIEKKLWRPEDLSPAVPFNIGNASIERVALKFIMGPLTGMIPISSVCFYQSLPLPLRVITLVKGERASLCENLVSCVSAHGIRSEMN